MQLADYTVVAKILKPQGRKGEVLAELLTDFPDKFTERASLLLVRPGEAPTAAVVVSSWLPTGRNSGRIVLHLEGVTSITEAEALKGADLMVPDADRIPLEDGAYYVSDLVGCTLTEDEHTLGIVRDVHFPMDANGKRVPEALPLLVVESPSGSELLIPMANAFLHKPDVANKTIEMRLPPGLLEING